MEMVRILDRAHEKGSRVIFPGLFENNFVENRLKMGVNPQTIVVHTTHQLVLMRFKGKKKKKKEKII